MATYDRQSRISVEKDKYEEKPDYSRDDESVDDSTAKKSYERRERRRFSFDEMEEWLTRNRNVDKTPERDH